LRAFMIKHYSKSHWNLLSKPERRAIIAMLQNYIKKQASQQENENLRDRTENHPKENSNGKSNHTQSENDHGTHQD
ncbi:MAG: hypothetical protein PHY48_07275, partial [Candidatus Cloacimonetes bacterium]|nr:hypothetical protein [Candidatus Cloacimonadota bacterium]